jgi:hypothetical protein
MKHLIFALLAVAFSLSVMAGKPTKEQITSDREQALSGADTCKFTIDEKGVKREATQVVQQKCAEEKGKLPANDKAK